MSDENDIERLQAFLQNVPEAETPGLGPEEASGTIMPDNRQAVLERVRTASANSPFDTMTEAHDCEGVLWHTVASIAELEGAQQDLPDASPAEGDMDEDSYTDDAEKALVDYEEAQRQLEAQGLDLSGLLDELMEEGIDPLDLPDGHEHDGKDRGEEGTPDVPVHNGQATIRR